jgi:hypothetical protein
MAGLYRPWVEETLRRDGRAEWGRGDCGERCWGSCSERLGGVGLRASCGT